MYFKDFDNYSYGTYYGKDHIISLDEVKTIGWLENGHDYPKGQVDEQTLYYLRKLIVTARYGIYRSKGFHYCDLCDPQPDLMSHPKIIFEGKEQSLGSAEFWLHSTRAPGTFYAAPNLIYHYIVDHGYRPPDEFLDAVNHYDFDLIWKAFETRQHLIERRRRQIRAEGNKLRNEANDRIFTLQPDDHYRFRTGLSGENIQILARDYDNRFILITFDAAGNLTQVIDRPMEEIDEDMEVELQAMFKEHGFVISAIRIKAFLLIDYAIGVNALSGSLDYFLRHLDEFSDKEKTEYQEDVSHWNDIGKFEFLWANDFWCDLDGYITDS